MHLASADKLVCARWCSYIKFYKICLTFLDNSDSKESVASHTSNNGLQPVKPADASRSATGNGSYATVEPSPLMCGNQCLCGHESER